MNLMKIGLSHYAFTRPRPSNYFLLGQTYPNKIAQQPQTIIPDTYINLHPISDICNKNTNAIDSYDNRDFSMIYM